MLLQLPVPDQGHVGGQHHQRLRVRVLVLLRPVPLAPGPLLVEQEAEVLVREHGGTEGPGPVEAGAVGVAAAERVRAGERDELGVVEAHAPEDGAQVRLLLCAVRQPAVGRAEGDVAVGAAGPPGDDGALHFLDGGDAGEGPQVGVSYPRESLWEDNIRNDGWLQSAWCADWGM